MNCGKCKIQKELLFFLNSQRICQDCKPFLAAWKDFQFPCEECEQQPGNLYCSSCQQKLCNPCSLRIHNKGKRAKHELSQIQRPRQLIKFILVIGKQNQQKMKQAISKLNIGNIKEQNILWVSDFPVQKQGVNKIHFQKIDQQIFNNLKVVLTNLKYYGSVELFIRDVSYPLQKMYIEQQKKEVKKQENIKKQQNFESIESTSYFSSNYSEKERKASDKCKKIGNHHFPIFQNFKTHGFSKCLSVQKELFQLAQKGTLMVLAQQFNGETACLQGVIRKTKRPLGNLIVQYYSLALQYLSLQSMVWVLQSIKRDRMTPNEKLILSRIKESFNLKIPNKVWSYILHFLQSTKYKKQIQKDPMTAKELPKLVVIKIPDPQLQMEVINSIWFENKWPVDDQGKVNEQQPSWKQFLNFIEQYFDQHKVIPGGRYGCVQFVKYGGNKILKQCSVGKLILYVQQAINKGIIRYHRTVLIKNTITEDMSYFINQSNSGKELSNVSVQKSFTALQKQLKIRIIQDAFVELLKQSCQGIPLAQIPQYLKKKLPFAVNFQQLGFTKLKSFILSINQNVY